MAAQQQQSHDMKGWVSYLDKEESPAAGTAKEDNVGKLGASLNAQAITATRKKRKEKVPPSLDKTLKIKMNVVNRLKKEVAYYHAEAKMNEGIVAKLEQESKDFYDVKQAKGVLEESYMMIPDSTKRFNNSLEELLEFVASNETDPAIAGSEQLAAAKELLQQNDMEEEAGADQTDVSGLNDGEIF